MSSSRSSIVVLLALIAGVLLCLALLRRGENPTRPAAAEPEVAHDQTPAGSHTLQREELEGERPVERGEATPRVQRAEAVAPASIETPAERLARLSARAEELARERGWETAYR